MMPWDPTEPLAERRTWLLEASAGTGKTYQIAGLYVRLVAELGIPVEKILAITFTQAATAELKDRIRTRLRLVRDALARPGTSGDSDPTVALLRALPAETHELHRRRLDLALLAFDEAAISTIHGFSQRSLAEFAFESGQDPALELMTSTVKLQEELVDDALALVHAGTNARQVALYEEAGLTRELLLRTAKELSAASVARIAPDVGTNEPLSLLPLLAERDARCQAHLEFFRTKRATLEADADHVNKQANLSKNLGAWEAFLSTGAELALPKYVPTTTWFRSKWKKGSPTIEERDWWSLATAVDDFVAKEAKFRREFLPLACFARGYRAALEARLDARAWLTFDGMLSRLAEGVERPGDPGSMLREKLAERYQAVFVDEFQDTDLAQWTVLRRAFHGRSRLFLIGDPKQAIYAFRGADVNVYLAAKHAVTTARAEGDGAGLVRTMAENWRSDRAAVSAMNHLWRAGSNAFDYPPSDVNEGMDYIEVAPSPKRRLEAPGTNDGAPVGFELRFLDGRLGRGNESAGTKLGRAQRRLAARLAAEEAHAWLSGANGPVRREGKTAEGVATEALAQPRPSDLAVLVPSHDDARAVRGALARLGIPSVTAAKALVFSSPAARWLEAWLDAVETAGRDREARAAVVTPLFGWTADDLAWSLAIAERGEEAREEARAGGYGNIEGATATDARDWNAWTERLRRATERWRRHGFARTLDRELDELGVLPRVLAMTAGERHATDLRHLLELLHAEERRRRLGPGALADWMRAEVDEEASEREQRLESDADAVKIETIHVSKGLEYPIVLLPFAWQVKSRKKKAYEPLALRDGEGKLVDFHPPDTQEREDAERVAARELEREQLRLLYVATTRAKHRTIAWWGPVGKDADKTDVTPLGRLALREAERTFEDTTYPTFKEAGSAANPSPLDVVRARLAALSEASARSITWTIVPRERPKPARWSPPSTNDAPAEWPTSRKAPSFSGYWSVTSYSGLAKGAAATDRDERLRKDEPSVQAALDGSPAPTATRASEPDDGDGAAADVTKPTLESCDEFGRLTAGRGTVFGTFVHEVFERLDFAAFSSDASTASSDRDASSAELRRIATETGARQGFGATSREVTDAVARLPGILTTPLGAEPSLTGTTRHGIPTSMLPTDFTLAHLSKRDRLDELGFDLKLGDGTRSKRPPLRGRPSDRDKLDARPGCVDPRAVYAALGHERDALSDRDGPSGLDRQGHHAAHGLRGWLAYQLARKDAGRALVGSIAGILTGSIDLVFRVPRPEGGHTYFLADYKTNTIDASTAAHYAGPWLDWKMATSGYVLQSLLYTLALHRHLQARLLGYMYDHHVGGALYLFVRGMGGRATPTCRATGHRLGVHAHRWSARTIAALDEALAPLRTSDARAHTKDGAR